MAVETDDIISPEDRAGLSSLVGERTRPRRRRKENLVADGALSQQGSTAPAPVDVPVSAEVAPQIATEAVTKPRQSVSELLSRFKRLPKLPSVEGPKADGDDLAQEQQATGMSAAAESLAVVVANDGEPPASPNCQTIQGSAKQGPEVVVPTITPVEVDPTRFELPPGLEESHPLEPASDLPIPVVDVSAGESAPADIESDDTYSASSLPSVLAPELASRHGAIDPPDDIHIALDPDRTGSGDLNEEIDDLEISKPPYGNEQTPDPNTDDSPPELQVSPTVITEGGAPIWEDISGGSAEPAVLGWGLQRPAAETHPNWVPPDDQHSPLADVLAPMSDGAARAQNSPESASAAGDFAAPAEFPVEEPTAIAAAKPAEDLWGGFAVAERAQAELNRREGQGFNYLFEREPTRLDMELMNFILRWGANNKASDVFFQSGNPVIADRYGQKIRLTRRVLEVDEVHDLANSWQKSNVARLMRGEEVNLRHVFTQGRDERYAFRVCVTACQSHQSGAVGVEIVARAIPWETPTIKELNVEQAITDAAYPNDGLILVTGPTGSGKSTLLAAILREAATSGQMGEGKRIVTYEEPIEFNLIGIPGMTGMVTQSEIPRDLPDFPTAIGNALRRKPEYILIGEARNKATIEGVIRASETGHTVFSTCHTKGVVNTIPRMADEFDPEARWAQTVKLVDSMRLIVHQRLVPSTDGKRVALREFLVFDEDLREKIIRGKEERFYDNMINALEKHGQTILRDAEKKLAEGMISQKLFDHLAMQKVKGVVE